jgi:hypothetical protein
MVLGGRHKLRAKPYSLLRWINRKQTDVATFPTPFDVNGPGQGFAHFGKKEGACTQPGEYFFGIEPIAVNKEPLDAESGIDQSRYGLDVRSGGGAKVWFHCSISLF